MALNSAQTRAVETTKGSLLIIAGPGTGKTKVIISKILKLIESGILPEKILAVTFSRKATQEMLDRVSEESPKLAAQINISTLHALCVDLVQRHGFRLGFQRKVELISEAQSHLFFRQVADRLPLQPFVKTSNFDPIIGELLNLFADCKDEGLWPEDLIRFSQSLPTETEDERKIQEEWMALGDVYNAYQNFCFEQGFMDFGDAILCALRILQNHPLAREEVQKAYDAILVDEFQDTNWSQVQLLRLISAPEIHVAVVGDDDQSIYRFRGASYSAFSFFKENFPNLEVVELNETYRLSPEIATAASKLIAANGEHRFLPNKQIKSVKKSIEAVKVIQSASYEDEASGICDQIEALLKEGAAPNSIGILVRAHMHSESILAEARRRKLPIEATASEAVFDQPIVKDVLAFFHLLIDPKDSISLLRLFDSPFLQLSAEEIFSFCKWGAFKKTALLELLDQLESSPLSEEVKTKLSHFFKIYKEVFAKASRYSTSDLLVHLCEQSSLVKNLLSADEGGLKILGQFCSQLKEWERLQPKKELRYALPLLEALERHEISLSAEEDAERSDDKISVLSIHASKGLEFEHVFVPSLVGRRFPGNFRQNIWKLPDAVRKEKAPTKESHLEEERRLFYVAMTRAKKSLTLTTIEKKGVKPSLFLSEDLKDLDSKVLRWIYRATSEESSVLAPKTYAEVFSRIKASKPLPAKNLEERPLHLSFTQLDKYETCPLAYRFKYDFQIPVATPAALTIGATVHFALEKFFKANQAERQPSREDLIQYFEQRFDEELKVHPDLSERDRNLGKEKLGAYFDFHQGRFPIPFAVEKDFSLVLGIHTIRGKIDRVDRDAQGNYVIVDYKTGKAKSNEKADDRKFAEESLQLSIYSLAAKEVFGWEVSEMLLYYIYENQSLSTTARSEEALELTKSRVASIASNILQRRFEPTPGHHCGWCEYRKICPAAN